MVGVAPVTVTVAVPVSVAVEFSSSFTVPVTTFVWEAPALPLTAPTKVHVYVAPGAIDAPAAQVDEEISGLPGSSRRLPNLSSERTVSVTGSFADEVFFT